MSSPTSTETVIRLSLSWLIVAAIAILLLGVTGGLLGTYIVRPPLPPLTHDTDRLTPTVQEVTISPNTARASLLDRVDRSVILLTTDSDTPQPVATGVVITNDGLIVTAGETTTSKLAAYDYQGTRIPLDHVGHDQLFNLTYYRSTTAVVVPLDVRREDVAAGEELIALTRNPRSFLPYVTPYAFHQFVLPTELPDTGLQRLMQGTSLPTTHQVGSPVVDDEGRVTGLVMDAKQGILIPANALADSLTRLANNQREHNPFAQHGLQLAYTFRTQDQDPVSFLARVTSIVPGSPAATSGLERGDLILKFADEPLAWNSNVATRLSNREALPLTIQRGDEQLTITLAPAS